MRSFDLIIFPHVWVLLCFHKSQTAERITENKTSCDQNLLGVTASICPAISCWPSSGKFFHDWSLWTISRGKTTSCSPTAGQILQLHSTYRHFHNLTNSFLLQEKPGCWTPLAPRTMGKHCQGLRYCWKRQDLHIFLLFQCKSYHIRA